MIVLKIASGLRVFCDSLSQFCFKPCSGLHVAFICLYLPCQPRETFLIERIIETKEGNEDEMFPDGWDERSISAENENIWKNIPGEKLPKFVGKKWKHSIGRFQ